MILMDLLMPVMDGIKVFPAIKAGAVGYLLKDSSPDELVRAIRQVQRGEPSLHPTIARKLLQEVAHPAELESAPEALTAREMTVLRLVAQGLSNQEIADRIAVSEPTVRAHVSRILGKLHLASRTQAALSAVREGLTSASNESSFGQASSEGKQTRPTASSQHHRQNRWQKRWQTSTCAAGAIHQTPTTNGRGRPQRRPFLLSATLASALTTGGGRAGYDDDQAKYMLRRHARAESHHPDPGTELLRTVRAPALAYVSRS